MSIEIFEVQSVGLADGVYKCYKQCLLESGWESGDGNKFKNFDEEPALVEILNVIENDTLPDYTPMLAKGDKIVAWEFTGCTGLSHRMGIPVVPSVRMAKVKEDAPASQQVICNLIANDGETERVSPELGSGITVYCKFCPAAVNLNEASPRLQSGDYIFVQNISGKWWCAAVFRGTEDCICNTE